ncbi:unnamed protein product [Dracunculus medinensis]|uniref:Secreted protein n=1 Tax=Dracunculus medinensis TaxID=318479 RepID=A0A0N4UIQ0_DRAME|nr:unnamed protein product [Dracunculus medinensis]
MLAFILALFFLQLCSTNAEAEAETQIKDDLGETEVKSETAVKDDTSEIQIKSDTDENQGFLNVSQSVHINLYSLSKSSNSECCGIASYITRLIIHHLPELCFHQEPIKIEEK